MTFDVNCQLSSILRLVGAILPRPQEHPTHGAARDPNIVSITIGRPKSS
jgi:hypothetical protein